MGSVTQIGISALLAYQRALEVTGHNIANANTQGYSRQSIEFSSRTPNYIGGSFIGTGVQFDPIERVVNDIFIQQLRSAQSANADMNAYLDNAKQLDALFASESVSIEKGMQDLYSALQSVVNDPGSIPARQVALQAAETFVNRLTGLDAELKSINRRVNNQVTAIAQKVNVLSKNIADLNEEILLARGSTAKPNDLLDQRDKMISELGELVNIRVVEEQDGTANVFIGGNILVLSNNANQVTAVTDSQAPQNIILGISTGPGGIVPINQTLSGGELSGLLRFRSEILKPSQNVIDRMALTFSEQVNQRHHLGLDLSGNLGGDFFNDINTSLRMRERSVEYASNSGNALIDVQIDNAGILTGEEYVLEYNGGSTIYTLMRASDGSTVTTFAAADVPEAIASEGFTINIPSGASGDGDRFIIRPTYNGALRTSMAISEPAQMAAAFPVRALENSTNVGQGKINIDSITNQTGTTLPPAPITLTFDAANNRYLASTGDIFIYDPTSDNGTQYTLGIAGFADVTFTLSDEPSDGDQLVIQTNTGATGDNRNVLSVFGTNTIKLMENGTTTFREVYTKHITYVGSMTNQADLNYETSESLLKQAKGRRESVSGVNLDEEAAALVKYQQAYQAAAKMVSITNDILDSVLQLVGR